MSTKISELVSAINRRSVVALFATARSFTPTDIREFLIFLAEAATKKDSDLDSELASRILAGLRSKNGRACIVSAIFKAVRQ